MADGISFVPLDCHFDDDKIPMIEAEFGLVGFAIVVKLFQKIYGGLGYYCEWSDRVALLFARQIGAGGDVVREVVAASIREGIFDGDMFQKYGVLTSRGIQKRFMNVAKRRKQIFDKPEYVLVCCTDFSDDVDISSKNVCNSGENVCSSETSKVKESKVKRSEVKGSNCVGDADRCAASPVNFNSLADDFGEQNVRDYEQRFDKWKAKKGGNIRADKWTTIAKWLKQDGVSKPQNKSSFDMDDVMAEIKGRYNEGK